MVGMIWWTRLTITLWLDGRSSSKMENLPLMQRLVAVLLYFNNLKWFFPCSQDTEGQLLGPVSTRNLLFCFLWVLKNIDSSLLQQWWYTLSIGRCGRLCSICTLYCYYQLCVLNLVMLTTLGLVCTKFNFLRTKRCIVRSCMYSVCACAWFSAYKF